MQVHHLILTKGTIIQILIVWIFACFAAPSLRAADFSISPILIEKEVFAGSKFPFEFQVKTKSPVTITVQPYDMKQLESGHMMFQQAKTKKKLNPSSWVTLNKRKFRLARNQRRIIKGKVSVPKNIEGTQLIALMVEEVRPPNKKGGVKIQVRYAVTIKIKVPTLKKQRNKGITSEAHLVSLKGKQLVLVGNFKNKSKHDFWVKAEAQIRNSKRKLIEKIQLKTRSAWERKDPASWVFPEAEVGLIGPIKKITEPGTYDVSIRYHLGGNKQVYFKKQIVVAPQMLPKSNVASKGKVSKGVKMIPDVLQVKFKKNNTSFNTFLVENDSSKPVTIKLPNTKQKGGIAKFQFIPALLELKPGAKKRVILKQFSPNKQKTPRKFIVLVTEGSKNIKKLNLHTKVQP